MERELEAAELQCAALQAARDFWIETAVAPGASDASLSSEAGWLHEEALAQLEQEAAQLSEEAAQCEALTSAEALPTWARRCPWRNELDVCAGQLERISLRFDATKRLLDSAHDERQWLTMSAQAVRDRLAQAERATAAEEARTTKLQTEHRQALAAVEALLQRWPAQDAGASGRPVAYHQARALLEAQCVRHPVWLFSSKSDFVATILCCQL